MDIKKYLETCSREELAEVLSVIPEVRDYLTNKSINERAAGLIGKIPNHLISGFYLEEVHNGNSTKELKKYILNHFTGSDVHILFTYFKLTRL